MKKVLTLLALAFTALALLPTSARADGVTDIRINPAATFTITTPGSYRLVGNVTMTANVHAISVSTPNVSLDLGGHTITGFTGNTSYGIVSAASGLVISNGSIVGFGESGLELLGVRSTARNIRVTGCNITGENPAIIVGAESVVENCTVTGNNSVTGLAYGIAAYSNSRIEGNIVQGNSGSSASTCYGIAAGARCIIRGNAVSGTANTGAGNAGGIFADVGSVIERNVCSNQITATTGTASALGIQADQCTIVGNECRSNSAGAGSNGSGVGINAGSRSLVSGNRCDSNNGAGTGTSNGIIVAANCRVEGNHCIGNSGGAASHGIRVIGASNLIADNSTSNHPHGGIIFLAATNNRCERNRSFGDPESIESTATPPFNAVAPSSIGGGDLANLP